LPEGLQRKSFAQQLNQTRGPNKTKQNMVRQTSETAELPGQAYEALKSAGLPIQQEHFPEKYHNEAFLRAFPSIPTPRGKPFVYIQKALNSSYATGSFEEFQAQLAGALIHLMFLYPAACLKALHCPEARPVFEMAAALDWEEHVRKLQKVICKPAESTIEEEV
jgi:hypothetical protein